MYCWTINFLHLRPIKRKQISEKIAERLNLSAETVDEIISCYYNNVQKSLSNLEHAHITVDNLGTFFIKRQKLEEKLRIYKKSLAKFETIKRPNMSEFKSIMTLKADIKNFERMVEELDKLDAKKVKKEEEKQIYKLKNHESNKTVEREGKDF